MYRRNHLAKVIAFAVSGHPNNGSTDQPAICGRSILALRLQAVRRPHGSSDFALQSGLRPADTPRFGRRGGFIETALPSVGRCNRNASWPKGDCGVGAYSRRRSHIAFRPLLACRDSDLRSKTN